MSGHSKWAQIKYKKSLTDAKKGKIFSKTAKMITIATRQKGMDPDTNPKLRLAIEKAKEVNMPSENIERAIKRGADGPKGQGLGEVIYEAYGPEGSALVIVGITDNTNRTSNEIKHLLSEHGGKIANPGSVLWMFKQKAVFKIEPGGIPFKAGELELTLIDAGAEDIKPKNGLLEIVAPIEKIEEIKRISNTRPPSLVSFSIEWVPDSYIRIKAEKKEKLEKLADALLENDDVQEIFSNVE